MLRALGHLAARELGIARTDAVPLLAPRLPSRYEAVEAAAPTPVDADAPHDAARRPVVDRSAAPLATASERIDAAPGMDGERVAPTDAPASVPAVVVHEVRRPVPQPDPVPRVVVVPSPRSPASTEREAAAAVAPLASPRTAEPARGDREPPTHGRDEASHALPPSQPRAKTPARDDTSGPREGAALQPLLPPRMPVRSTLPTAAAPVHVTIGRIEIRAAKDAAAEPASGARRANSPSLAAYLRRRSEGGRS
ncbi:hypothetical protein FHW12_004198 [Dokdonella fugitiva]|uniref:Uncharacterized protein n=1 Tax=Dokdonella fugitiva TaxID=328517 RepID=A0A839FCU7_9GAMM|nr:hypothetical protein [Dokdonella fugitiva]MBA8889951.1 hypothetical protein [Dokdonella fugitiva]